MKNNNHGLVPLGILLILAGIIVFLVNLGYGSWDFIWQLWRFWPVIIILIGVKLLLPYQVARWVSYAFWILVAAGIIFFFLKTPKDDFQLEQTELGGLQHYVINRNNYPGVTAGKASLSFGGGKLEFGSLTSEWFEGDFGGFAVRPVVKRSQNTLLVELKQSGRFQRDWRREGGNRWTERDFNWYLNLSPELEWDLSMRTGAIKGEADLSGVRLRDLSIKMGAGDLDLTLGNPNGNTMVKVEAGASNIKIRIPGDAAVKVKISGALVNNNVKDWGWTRHNRTYTSPGYDQAANHLDIIINMAVGNFDLIR